MNQGQADWAIVLAAGRGSRLRALTRDDAGREVPKQFCSLDGGPTLFEQALARAAAVTAPERVVAVLAEEHRALWEPQVGRLAPENRVVQPENRGTAVGLLLPLLAVLARAPEARLVVLPSDHYVRHEGVLETALLEALDTVGRAASRVVLLGITPDEAVSDYGWILPAPGTGRLRAVERFVEKPGGPRSVELLEQGALWNSFLLAARGSALLGLYRRRLPRLLAAFRGVDLGAPAALARLYERLDEHDFSRAVLEGSERGLRVLEVPPCEWTDLGTPARVARCLRQRGQARPQPAGPRATPVLERALLALGGLEAACG